MKKIWRRVLGWQLIFMLLVAFFPGAALAAEKPDFTLEQAIRLVKENFDIPAGFTKFESSYNSYDNRLIWSLNWNATGEPGGSFNAEVNAKTGEIINMRLWQYELTPQQGIKLPSISATKARAIAVELVERLLPQRLDELKLLPAEDQIVPLNPYDRVTYAVRWQREVNGIPVAGDGVTVEVRGDTGQVVGYNLSWIEADFPAAGGAISQQQARQVFEDNEMLELQYFLASIRPLAETGEKEQPQLVYRLYHPSNGVIDALQGEPLQLEDGMWLRDGGLGGMGEMARDMEQKSMANGGAPVPLSPEELQEIERTARLISQAEAIAALKKWVEVPAYLILSNANLMADWQEPETRIWNLHWYNEQAEADQIRYLSGRVNAVNGELMGFDLYYEPADPSKPGSLNREEARQLAEKFLKQVQPQRFAQVEMDKNYVSDWDPQPLKQGENPRMQRFNYHRVVNGVVFPGNSMNIAIDTVAKRVTSYSLSWQNLNFPAPRGLLTARQANDVFLAERPLTLTYTQVYIPNKQAQMRLVYQPTVAPGKSFFELIDAKNGQPLDWQGKPLAQQPRVYHFNDIAGHFAAREINLLGQAGIFGEYGNAFHPDEKVTIVSLLRAMLMANDGIWGVNELTDAEILKRARDRKWLQEDLTATDTVNRETLAKLMVRMLNLERAAGIEGIYQVPFDDSGGLPSGSIGYVALTWGLGIIPVDDNNFVAARPVTRAEAAFALVKAMVNKQY